MTDLSTLPIPPNSKYFLGDGVFCFGYLGNYMIDRQDLRGLICARAYYEWNLICLQHPASSPEFEEASKARNAWFYAGLGGV